MELLSSQKIPLRVDTGLQCLVLIARYHLLAADIAQLIHQFSERGDALGITDLLRAARYLSLKAKAITFDRNKLGQTALPAIRQHKDGHFFIIAKMAEDKVLIQDPLEKRPLSLPRAVFEQSWSGELILISKRALLPGVTGQFDFSWFIPAIFKYKKHIGEVLLASLKLSAPKGELPEIGLPFRARLLPWTGSRSLTCG